MSLIHETAIISPKAELASDVKVGPYSVIGDNVKIDSGTTIAPHVVIEGYTTIGKNNKFFQFSSIGSAPQDLKYRGENSEVIIGDNNTIREYVTIQPGTEGGIMKTEVGSNNLFMACAHIAHDCIVGDHNIFANNVLLAGHVTIGSKIVLGGAAAVHQFVYIGDIAMVAGGGMLERDLPPFCMAQGDRAKVRGLNTVGLKRSGFSASDISDLKKIYKSFFSIDGNIKDFIDSLDSSLNENEKLKPFIDFVSSDSKRGFITA